MASQEELRKRLKVLMNRAENQVCSDCPERQPRWASLIVPPPGAPPGTSPIGAFCCLECSGSHRRLGVHISFVRSVNLDSWKEKEVLAMENGGNRKVNAIFEARLPPGIPKPHAGADGPTRERFIRDKYERRKFYDPSGFDNYCAPPEDDDEDDVRSRYSTSVRSTRSTPPIRPPSDAARLRVENRQAQQQPPPRVERRGSERSKVPKAPRSAPASFDLLDLSAPPTMTMPAMESNFLQAPPPPERAPSPKEITVSRNSYAADLLTPMPTSQTNSNINTTAPKNSHDQIMSLFNSPPPQQTTASILGGMPTNGDFNPLMVNPNMMGMSPQQQQQQQQAAMMNMMVQPRSNMMAMMQQQQHQQQRMLHQRMMEEQQTAAAAAGAGFGANVMVQPKANVPDQQSMQQAYQNSFHHSFIFTNDGYDNGYGNNNNNNNNNNNTNNNMNNNMSNTNNNNMNNNGIGYGGNQVSNQMNMMQQQQQQQQNRQQQNYSGMLMSNSLHGTSSSGGGMGGMAGLSLSSSHDEGGFPSMPMGGTVMASSGPLVSGMHRPMNRSPPPPTDLPPKPPRKEDPFAQFGMNVFRS